MSAFTHYQVIPCTVNGNNHNALVLIGKRESVKDSFVIATCSVQKKGFDYVTRQKSEMTVLKHKSACIGTLTEKGLSLETLPAVYQSKGYTIGEHTVRHVGQAGNNVFDIVIDLSGVSLKTLQICKVDGTTFDTASTPSELGIAIEVKSADKSGATRTVSNLF